MNTQIIAIANQKGGVGKTTTCANLGIGLAQEGKKVLLIDGDPQGSLSISLGYSRPDTLPVTLSDMMGKVLTDTPIQPGEGILHHAEGVDLMPADIQLSGMEVSLVNAMSRETILRQYLDTVKRDYTHILIDCQPSLGMLTVNALAAANRVLIPVQAEYLPAKGLEQLLQTISKVRRQINPKLQIDGILLTMVDGRTNFAKEISALLRETYGSKIKVFGSEIPHSVRAKEMADMMAGIISKLLKGLCDSLRYQSLGESTNKKILDTGWFCLNEVQLGLYKKLYRLICEWQPAWYKSYSGIYSDDLVVFNALLNFMNHFESVEQIRADIDMQGEYFNAFACEQLTRYFNQRRCKLPIEPVIPFDEESYLNQRGGKVYFDSRKQLLLPLHGGSQTFDVLSVGVDQKFTPTVTILKDGEPECFRLPNELSEWACRVVGMAAMGMNPFPAKVTFSNITGRYYVDIL